MGYRDLVPELTIDGTTISAVGGDLTRQEVDAIVNAANEYLQHGGGLAGAIVFAGGGEIQEESDLWLTEHGPLSPGVAAVTGAGRLPARLVIHVAGPRYLPGQDNPGLLSKAVAAALDAAAAEGCRTVALPAISAGIFGYPLAEATRVVAAAAAAWAEAHPGTLDEIRLVGFGAAGASGFAAGLAESAAG
jgi:O-acetyl-ADP-ribose deacetylase (regulator of RNase III)